MDKILLALLSCYSLGLQKAASLPHKKIDVNLFHKVHNDIQNTINGILTLLDLDKNFTIEPSRQLLLTLHKTIKSVAVRNYEAYETIKAYGKSSIKHKHLIHVFNLSNITDKLVQEELSPENIKRISDVTNRTGIKLQLTPVEIPHNWNQSLAFLKEYFSNVEDTDMISKDSPLQKIKDEFEKNLRRRKVRRNLKVWKAFSQNTNQTKNYTATRRVYHGKTVKIKNYPFIASVHVMREFVCAGSIISKNMILTAATCLHVALQNERFLKDNPEGVIVRVGSAYTQRFGDVYRATQIYFHPNYNTEDLANNLAILKTEKISFNDDRKIRRIQYLRWKERLPSDFHEVVMLGWGDKESIQSSEFEPLSFAYLNIYNQQQCVQKYTGKYVNEKNFCAGFVNEGSGACQRDVGGPAIVGSFLVGVVSFGPPVCGTPDAPTVFSNVGYYTAWIDEVVRENLDEDQKQVTSNKASKHKYPLPTNYDRSDELQKKKRPQTNQKGERSRIKPIHMQQSYYPINIQFLQNLLNQFEHASGLNGTMYRANEGDHEDTEYGMHDHDKSVDSEENDRPIEVATRHYTTLPRDSGDALSQASKGLEKFAKAPSTGDVININTGQLVNNVVTGLQTELIKTSILSGSTDPFFLAIKSLANYLGLEKYMQMEENYRSSNVEKYRPHEKAMKIFRSDKINGGTNGLQQESSAIDKANIDIAIQEIKNIMQPRNEISHPEPKYEGISDATAFLTKDFEPIKKRGSNEYEDVKKFDQNEQTGNKEIFESIENDESDESYSVYYDPNVSDNYESESEGLSIEIQNNTIPPITDILQTEKGYYDRAQEFLSKNFVPDNNLTLSEIEKSDNTIDELVVLLLQTSTKKPFSKSQNMNFYKGKRKPPSRYSVISNANNYIHNYMNDVITITKFNKTITKPKNKIEVVVSPDMSTTRVSSLPLMEVQVGNNQAFFKNDLPLKISRLRSFDDNQIIEELLKLEVTATTSTPSLITEISTSSSLATIESSIKTLEPETIATEIKTSTETTTITTTESTTITTTMTSTTTATTDETTTFSVSPNEAKMSKIESTTNPKEITMAAYDMAEELAENLAVKDKGDDEGTDLESQRILLDYFNIR